MFIVLFISDDGFRGTEFHGIFDSEFLAKNSVLNLVHDEFNADEFSEEELNNNFEKCSYKDYRNVYDDKEPLSTVRLLPEYWANGTFLVCEY